LWDYSRIWRPADRTNKMRHMATALKHSPAFTFPTPTGPYGIGTVTYHWVDADRPEVFTADSADRRELMVQVWYPAEGDASAPHAPWIADAGIVASGLARLLHVPAEGKLVHGFEGVEVGDRIRVQLISLDVQQGFIDFRRTNSS